MTLIAVMGASEVSLALDKAPPCVDAARLIGRLERAGLMVTSRRGLHATLTTEAAQLRLRAQRADSTFERTIPIGACDGDALERVVTALLSAWAKPLPQEERAAARPPVRAGSPPPSESAPVVEPEAPPTPAATPPSEVTPIPVAPPKPTEPTTTINDVPVRTPPPPSAWEWDASLLGGVTVDPNALATGAGQVELGVINGHFGALFELGLQSSRVAEAGGVRVEASTQWASLSARALFRPTESTRVEIAVGLRAWRVAGQSSGFGGATSTALANLGAVASSGLSWRVAGPLALQARLFGSLRSEGARFFVASGPSLQLSPWEFGLLAGLTLIL